MRGVLRSLVLASSVAAGSWVGLVRPFSASPPAPLEEHTTIARPAPSLLDFPPLPQETSPESVPSLRPWPRLNPEASIERAWKIAEGPHKTTPDNRRLVTLTFDDGPFLETTPDVLRLLAKYKVHATFFVIGRYLDGDSPRARATRRLLARIAAQGHLIGNHSHDHARLSALSRVDALAQIEDGQASIERVLGKKVYLFRPPYGELDEFGRHAARDRSLDVVLWSAEVGDMGRDDPQQMARELVAQIDYKDGGLVLLHDVRRTSVAALEKLLERLDRRRWDPSRPDRWGYEIVDLPQYLRETAASPPLESTSAGSERAAESNGS